MAVDCRLAIVYFFGQLLWVIVTWVLAISKIVVFSIISFVSHITNWAWVLAGFVYLLTLPFLIPSAAISFINVNFAGNIVFWCFFPLNTIIWFVFISVIILLTTDPEFITDIFTQMEPGLVIIANDVFHVFPVIILIFFIAIQHRLIYYGLKRWYATESPYVIVVYTLYQLVVAILLFVGLYLATLALLGKSVHDVYGTEIPVGAGLGLLLLVSALVSGIPLLIMCCCCQLLEESHDPLFDERHVYMTTHEIYDSYSEEMLAMLKKYDTH